MSYNGKVTDGVNTVGYFIVDGHQAFCTYHAGDTPTSDTSQIANKEYNNTKAETVLYYGLDGPGDIFKDEHGNYYDWTNWTDATIATTLALDTVLHGNAYGKAPKGYQTLVDKAGSTTAPDYHFHFSNNNPNVNFVNGQQVSDTITLVGDSRNSVTLQIPDGMHLHNNGHSTNGVGSETIYGGESFYLTADAGYNNDWSSGDVSGTLPGFTPYVMTFSGKGPSNHEYQPLANKVWKFDPPPVDGIHVHFYPRTVTETIHYKDRETGQEVRGDTQKTVTIGSRYDEWTAGNQWYDNHTELPIGDNEQQGTVPSYNYDLTFWYSTQWTLHANYIDTWTGQTMWTEDTPNIWTGSTYDKWASQGTFDRDGHHYEETGQNHVTGTMPRGDLTVSFYYDPYNHARVTWQNAYPANDVFKSADDLVKVGNGYYYDQPGSFTTADGRVFDRITGDTFNGSMPYNDISHVFDYHLRRHVEVNYYDNRTGQKIQDSKAYDLHQGDAYSESPPVITTSRNGKDYTYRYVREDGSSQNGTISTDNVTINYYYDLPLIQAGVKTIKVYTAPASDGLPVRVYLDKLYNYDSSIGDMSKKMISVTLMQGDKALATQPYSAKDLPTDTTFKVPANVLKVNDHEPYTVALTAYDPNDFDVMASERQVTTQGYTSSQDTIDFDVTSNSTHSDSQKRVVMTEDTVGQPMQTHDETFTYYARPLPPNKTGYGSATNLQYTYLNELGDDYQYATTINDEAFTFQTSSKLQDTSYLNYPVKDGVVNVPMTESAQNADLVGANYQRNETFVFPHVNVEDENGHLFTDKQAADHDARIQHKLYDGGNEFYTPIWPDQSIQIPATFPVDYVSNPLGVNQVTLRLDDQLKLVAYMYAWMGSPTISKDELLMIPVNTDNPFPEGLPAGWTKSDEEWIEHE
ncbi:MAG: MucBP domain-containing protein [Sporolactobacillus sp.]